MNIVDQERFERLERLSANAHHRISILIASLGREEQARMIGENRYELQIRRRLPAPLARLRDWFGDRLSR